MVAPTPRESSRSKAAKAEATQGRAGSYKKTQSHVEHSSEAARKKKEEATEAARAQNENMVAWARSLSHERIITDTTKKTHPEEDTAGLAS